MNIIVEYRKPGRMGLYYPLNDDAVYLLKIFDSTRVCKSFTHKQISILSYFKEFNIQVFNGTDFYKSGKSKNGGAVCLSFAEHCNQLHQHDQTTPKSD